jgi:hypothetical protein
MARITSLATARDRRAQSSQLMTLIDGFLSRYSVPTSRAQVERYAARQGFDIPDLDAIGQLTVTCMAPQSGRSNCNLGIVVPIRGLDKASETPYTCTYGRLRCRQRTIEESCG